jgi:hypothetical protein
MNNYTNKNVTPHMEFARTLALSLPFSNTSILITVFFVLFNLLIGRYVQSGVGVA